MGKAVLQQSARLEQTDGKGGKKKLDKRFCFLQQLKSNIERRDEFFELLLHQFVIFLNSK
jgi:hypothetical protein